MSASIHFIVRFAEMVTGGGFDFTGEDYHQARLSFLDTIACMRAGIGEPQYARALDAMRLTAPGAVRPMFLSDGLTVAAAALVNGTAAHALDFDDYEAAGSTHPGAPVIGALLALAQQDGVPYPVLLKALLVGHDAIVSLGEALGYGHYMAGWHSTATVGTVGVAAAAASALGLEPTRFCHALGLSMSMAGGLKVQFGTDTKALHAGLAARAGLEAAFLARAGMTASLCAAEEFVSVYGTSRSPGLRGLPGSGRGKSAMQRFPVLRKPWPCCAYTHRPIEAALAVARTAGFSAERVQSVLVSVPAPYAQVAGFLNPQTGAEARFSIRWCVALALLDGEVGPDSFSPVRLGDPSARDFLERVRVQPYDPGEGVSDMSPDAPDSLEVKLANGERLFQSVGDVKGGPKKPLNEQDLIEKFIACGGTAHQARYILAAPKGSEPFDLSRLS